MNLPIAIVAQLIVTAFLAQVCAAQLSTNNLRRVSDEEFLQGVHAHQEFTNCLISFAALRQALRDSANAANTNTIKITHSTITKSTNTVVTVPTNIALNVEIDIDGCDFEQADFAYLQFSSHSVVSFGYSTFHCIAEFEGTKFLGVVDFRMAKFENRANFYGAFLGYSIFDGARFSTAIFEGIATRMVSFRNTTFANTLYFGDVMINGDADFGGAYFNAIQFVSLSPSIATLRSQTIRGNLFGTHVNSQFARSVNFQSCTFSNEVNLAFVSFGGDVDFTAATFHSRVSLERCVCKGSVSFKGNSFLKGFSGRNCIIEKQLSFEDMRFEEETDFSGISCPRLIVTQASFASDVSFKLVNHGSSSGLIRLQQCRFRGRVSGDDSNLWKLEIVSDLTPTMFEREVSFRRCEIYFAELTNLDFGGLLSFERSKISELHVKDVHFAGSLDLRNVAFRGWNESAYDIVLDRISIGGSLQMVWHQLDRSEERR